HAARALRHLRLRSHGGNRIPRHHNPGHNVSDNTQAWQGPDGEHHPEDAHQRHIDIEIARESCANSLELGAFPGTGQSRRLRACVAGRARCAALPTEFMLILRAGPTTCAEHHVFLSLSNYEVWAWQVPARNRKRGTSHSGCSMKKADAKC